jgi:hypothetical protein
MLTKPFNEAFLWKGKIQRARYPNPTLKNSMDIPGANPLTGKPYPTNDTLHDEQCASAYVMSQNYWTSERQRRQSYREKHAGPPPPMPPREPEERIYTKICTFREMVENPNPYPARGSLF